MLFHVYKYKRNGIIKINSCCDLSDPWRGKGSLGIVVCICGNGWEVGKSEDTVVNVIKMGHRKRVII